MGITLIAAMGRNWVIGKEGQLAWDFRDFPEDMARFRKATSGQVVVMGRKTYDSIGKPLPKRVNVVISKTMAPQEGLTVVPDVHSAITFWNENHANLELFVIGGQQIYEQMLPYASKILLTHLPIEPVGDTYFPKFDFEKEWKGTILNNEGELIFEEFRRSI